jgi:GDPmannose 4,6-dehydratase
MKMDKNAKDLLLQPSAGVDLIDPIAVARWFEIEKPEHFFVDTGETYSVRPFAKKVFERLGVLLECQGEGVHEKGIDHNNGEVVVEMDAKYFHRAEIGLLPGDPAKVKTTMGWESKTHTDGLVAMMVDADLKLAEREKRRRGNADPAPRVVLT